MNFIPSRSLDDKMETLMKKISTQIQLTILKPVQNVFAAAALPIPFFVAKASGPLKQGQTIHWTFPEFSTAIPIKVLKVVPNRLIRFQWQGLNGQNTCEFTFAKPTTHNPKAKVKGNAVTLSIRESGWPDTEKGRKMAQGNTMGWTHMACALKAYLEYGVNLRKGAFLHYKF
jgi:uncharacterized protein YndB with AHSA1/START domain